MRQFIYLAAAFLLVATACGDTKQAAPTAPPPVKVVLDPVTTGSATYYVEYPATLTPLNQVDLRPQVTGYITGIHFKDGDRVKKNQLLYSIDAQLYTANYNQAQANLYAQEANLVKAQKDADRYHELAKHDAVAKQLVDNADAALEVAKKQVDAARANISASQTSVRYTKIYAPFDGLIGISAVKAGAPVSAGQTILNSISSDKDMAVDFNVDQREIFYFSSLLNKKATDSTFTLAFGNNVYPVPGRLAFLDRAVDPQTGTIKARLVFPNKNDVLRAGMNGTVRVKTDAPDSTLMIPYKAVVEQLGEYFVYAPGDSNKVSQRKITLGTVIGKNVIIKTGLHQGDSVVSQGVQNLREGSVIQSVSPATSDLPKNN